GTTFQMGPALKDIIPQRGRVPLSFQPGTAWEYSPAYGFDTLGHIVELVSGTTIDRFLDERIFEPLGIRSSGFFVPEPERSRMPLTYERSSSGLRAGTTAIRFLAMQTTAENRYYSGGGGLVGTAEDYARFCMMLANGGLLDGAR